MLRKLLTIVGADIASDIASKVVILAHASIQ